MEARDWRALHPVFSDPAVMKYFDDVHTTHEQTRRWVHSSVNAPAKETLEYVLELNGQVIGKAGIWKAPELGFLMHQTAWGQGYMFEALGSLLPYLAQSLNLERLLADVDPRNSASRKLLEKLGFIETHRAERTIQIGGEWADSVYLAWAPPRCSKSG